MLLAIGLKSSHLEFNARVTLCFPVFVIRWFFFYKKCWCQISEYQIIEISENVCNLKKREADWILKIDIVEQGDRLDVSFSLDWIPKFFVANFLSCLAIQTYRSIWKFLLIGFVCIACWARLRRTMQFRMQDNWANLSRGDIPEHFHLLCSIVLLIILFL